jgi:serine-type D-Ala-D-Ala carboxypeptidase (penicillin-binding protein 5/6)
MNDSPFLPRGSGSRHARAREKRRRWRLLTAGAIAIVVAAVAAIVVLSRSGVTHGSAAPGRTTGRPGKRSSDRPRATPTRSPAGLPLGHPPLALDLAGSDPVRVAFHHEPRAGLLFDLDSGRVLWAREPTRVLPIASLSKMMTALLVVRARPPDADALISRRAVNAPGSKIGLLPLHKRVPLETLLYGLLLPSGNDAATALAESVSGSVPRFVSLMNREAAHLGLGCTHYASPDGLDNANSSCAADLAELAHIDLDQPRIAAVARSASAIRPFPIKGGKLYLYNNNPLLRYRYPGATGLKTGETEAAGLCLVGTAERHGVKLGVVLLHSPELGRQAAYLLNRGFESVYGQAPIPEPPIPAGR